MISATPGAPIHSDELARIAYLRTFAYASALEILHKYKLRYAGVKNGPDAMKNLALEIVIALIEKDGARQMQEANTTWQSAKLVAALAREGGETDSTNVTTGTDWSHCKTDGYES